MSRIQTWIDDTGECFLGRNSKVDKQFQINRLRGYSVQHLGRGGVILTAAIGSIFFGLTAAAEVTPTGLTGRVSRRAGMAPQVLATIPPQSIFPNTPFSLEISPTDYFFDPNSPGFKLEAVEKDKQTLPNWLNSDLEGIYFLGAFDPPNDPRGVDVKGNFAYLAHGFPSLLTINVSNPFAPTLTGSCDTPGDAREVSVLGDFVYVADGPSGLSIIDVSIPDTPTLVGSYDISGTAYGLDVIGNLAFIADYDFGLQIIDISNRTNPTLIGSYATAGNAQGVDVIGNFAYVADRFSGLQIIDVSNPSSPTLTGSYNTPSDATNVNILGDFAYVADRFFGLQIIDISNPSTPILVGSFDTPSDTLKVRVLENFAYIADSASGLQILDVSNPSDPKLVESYATSGDTVGLNIVGNFVYVVNSNSGLHILERNLLLTGSPRLEDIGNYEIELIAEDSDLNQASSTFNLIVEGPPVATGTISNKLLNVEAFFNFFIDQSVFADLNTDVVFYFAKQANGIPLPSWLSFSTIGIFSGIPQPADTGKYDIRINAYDGIVLGSANTTFSVTVDHFPEASISLLNQAADINVPYSLTLPTGTFTDKDVGDVLTYSATQTNNNPLPSWLSFNSTNLHFSGTATAGDAGSISIKVSATDIAGATATSTFTLIAGEFPTLLNPIPDQFATVGTPYLFSVPSHTFTTPPGELLTYRATKDDGSPLPSWLGFTGPRLEFQGTPQPSNKGTDTLKVIAEDSKGGLATGSFNLNILEVLAHQTARIDGPFAYSLPSDMISSPLGPITYTVTLEDGSSLPTWLNYNPTTNTLSGTPLITSESTYSILVTADDGIQEPVLGILSLAVIPNAAPKVANPVSNQAVQVGQPFRFIIPDNTFADPNDDALDISAKRANGRTLPTWLTFSNRTLEGKPGPSDTGTFNDKTVPLQICATDGDQEACTFFDLSVQGSSNTETALAIIVPLAGAAGLAIGWYNKRGVILNPWNRKKYDKGTKSVSIGYPFEYKLETSKDQTKLVKAFEGRRMLCDLPAPKTLDQKGWLEWLKYDDPIPGGELLPRWLEYDLGENMLISESGPKNKDIGQYIVRIYGPGEVILEEVKLDVGGLSQ